MPIEVIMPKVDMDMAKGKIVTWHVSEGDTVTKGEPLFDIETDKAAMEVEAADSGILHHAVPEGTDVPIGKPVAWLYAEGEEVGDPPAGLAPAEPDAPAVKDDPAPRADAPRPGATRPEPDAGEKQRATPRARALARDGGVDIDAIAGTGPRGRVQAGDVAALLDRGPAQLGAATFRAETGPLSVTRSKGGTGTPVVMIHGFASDATSWAPLEAHLKHRPVIRIDLPGHGKSPKLKVASFAALLQEVRRTFDDLNLDQAHLIGHSLGGALALGIADTRARGVASLTLIAPAGLGPDIDGTALSGMCRASRAESLAPWLRRLVADEDIITDSYVRLAMAGRSDPNLRAAQSAMADTLFPDGVQAVDLRAALDRLTPPARIIWGKRDAIIPWRHALRAPGRVALHLFDGIGHMPQIECAEEVGVLLRSQI